MLKRDAAGSLTCELDMEKLGERPLGELSFGKLAVVDGLQVIGVKKVKGASVLGALELLGKYHKLFMDKFEHDLSDELIRKLNEGRARVGELPINIKGEIVVDT